jgi:hypothetical protein
MVSAFDNVSIRNYFCTDMFWLFNPKAGPRLPGRTLISYLENCQPLFCTKIAPSTLPCTAKTLKRLEVMPKELAADLAAINV